MMFDINDNEIIPEIYYYWYKSTDGKWHDIPCGESGGTNAKAELTIEGGYC